MPKYLGYIYLDQMTQQQYLGLVRAQVALEQLVYALIQLVLFLVNLSHGRYLNELPNSGISLNNILLKCFIFTYF